jgi:hypothetical protein
MKSLFFLVCLLLSVGISLCADVDFTPGSSATGRGRGGRGGGGGRRPDKGKGGPQGHKTNVSIALVRDAHAYRSKMRTPHANLIDWLLELTNGHAETRYMTKVRQQFPENNFFPVKRAPEIVRAATRSKAGRSKPVPTFGKDKSPSYNVAGMIHTYGTENHGGDRCDKCIRNLNSNGLGLTFRGCVSFPIGEEYPLLHPVPYRGECSNCHWGNQGSGCSIRAGGGT